MALTFIPRELSLLYQQRFFLPLLVLQRHIAVFVLKKRIFDTDNGVAGLSKGLNGVVVLGQYQIQVFVDLLYISFFAKGF